MSSLSCDWRSSGITGTRRSIPRGFFSTAVFAPPFLPSAALLASAGRATSAAFGWGASAAPFLCEAAGLEWALSRATEGAATAFSAATTLGLLALAGGLFLVPAGGLCLRVVMIRSGGGRPAFPLCAGQRGPTQGAPKQSGQFYLTRV